MTSPELRRHSSSSVNTSIAPDQPKKLVINLTRKPPQLPKNFEEETWKKLKQAISSIFNKTKAPYGSEELFQACSDLCSHKKDGWLYSQLQNEIKSHIKQTSLLLLSPNPTVDFLTIVDNCWQDHCDQMMTIRGLFLYLDRTFVIKNSNIRSIWDMGLQLFRDHIMTIPEISKKTLSSLLSSILKERKGETINRTLIKNILRMFSSLGIYTDNFEKEFLTCTGSFYSVESRQFLQDNDVAQYLQHVERRLHDESERVLHYLDQSTRKPLIHLVETQLIEVHQKTILEKGFDELMNNSRKVELNRLFVLFSRVNALHQLNLAWKNYINTTGVDMVTNEEKDPTLVQDLLDYKAKLDSILEESFHSNPNFANSLKDAFETFVNVRQNKPAELIAKFVDAKLRSGNKGAPEELETVLDKIMVLFRFIQGKDVFEAFFKKDLAKRLLLGKSASFDAEKYMISKLKLECGNSFTSRVEGMFKDIDLSKDIMASFKQSVKHQEQLGDSCELMVNVLTTGYWPTYTPVDVKLPPNLSKYQEIFKEFYLSKHSGRRLLWQNSLGHTVLKASFPLGAKELSVSLFQTVVLLLFNDQSEISYSDIKEATGIEEKELKRTLQSLACGKVRVLHKKPKGRDVDDTDTFSFNKEFSAKLFRIKVNSIQMKETVEEAQKTNEGVIQDRQWQIDAAIVRIMKTRKSLAHNLLVSELFQHLKFPFNTTDLKKRIDSLIEREYLETDPQNPKVYQYLA